MPRQTPIKLGHINHEQAERQSKLLQRFDSHYDDSSDEEEIEKARADYDINLNWASYQTSRNIKYKNRSILNQDELLSFVAHAAGIDLFYSSEVNRQYYSIKKKVFEVKLNTHSGLSTLNLQIKNAIEQAFSKLDEVMHCYLKFAVNNKILTKQVLTQFAEIKEKFLNSLNNFIEKHVSDFVNYLFKTPSISLMECEFFSSFQKQLLQLFNEIFLLHFKEIKKNTLENKPTEILSLAQEKIKEFIENYQLDEKYNLTGKQETLDLLKDNLGIYPNLTQLLMTILEKTCARGKISNLISHQVENKTNENALITAILQDLREAYDKKLKLPNRDKKIFEKYHEFSLETLYLELVNNLTLNLQCFLPKAIMEFKRPTLGKHSTLFSQHPLAFLANLRLVNRSQKRQILNLQSSLFKQDCVVRTYRLNPGFNEDELVLERQEILSSLGRRDMVENLGNYEKIETMIEQIKSSQKSKEITDQKIAYYLRAIYQGEALPNLDPEILQKLHALCYLLLGCEAIRNPSMHILNQMLLDLIIENKDWNFKQAFTAKLEGISARQNIMPMTPEGAVSTVRALESDYQAFMPYPYSYRGISDDQHKLEMIKHEANVVRAWLKMTVKEDEIASCKKNKAAQFIFDKMKAHYEKWFAISKIKMDLKRSY